MTANSILLGWSRRQREHKGVWRGEAELAKPTSQEAVFHLPSQVHLPLESSFNSTCQVVIYIPVLDFEIGVDEVLSLGDNAHSCLLEENPYISKQ